MTSPHGLHNPEALPEPRGYTHAVAAARGRTIYLAGQIAADPQGRVVGETMAEQFDRAAANVVAALNGAGAGPEHLVSMLIFVTDVEEYRRSLAQIGRVYQGRFGRHYPASALLGVAELFDPAAKVELVCVAVVPDE